MNVTKSEPSTSAQTVKLKQPRKAAISKTHLWAEMDVLSRKKINKPFKHKSIPREDRWVKFHIPQNISGASR